VTTLQSTTHKLVHRQHKHPRMHHYLQGLHHWLCWSRPYRARHFFILLPTTSTQLHLVCWLVKEVKTCSLSQHTNMHSMTKMRTKLQEYFTLNNTLTSTAMQVKSFPLIVFEFVKSIHKNQNYGLNFIGDKSASQKGIIMEVKKV